MNADRIVNVSAILLAMLGFAEHADKVLCVLLIVISSTGIYALHNPTFADSPVANPVRVMCIGWAAIICTQQLLTITVQERGPEYVEQAAVQMVNDWSSGRARPVQNLDGTVAFPVVGSYLVHSRPGNKVYSMPLGPVVTSAVDSHASRLNGDLSIGGIVIIMLIWACIGWSALRQTVTKQNGP